MAESYDWLDTRVGQTVRSIFDAVAAARPDVELAFDGGRPDRAPPAIEAYPPSAGQDLPPLQQPDQPAHHVARDLVWHVPVRIWGDGPVDAEDLLHAFVAALSTADDDDDEGAGFLRAAVSVASIGAWQAGTQSAGVSIPLELAVRVPVYNEDLRRGRRPTTAPLGLAVTRPDGSTEPA